MKLTSRTFQGLGLAILSLQFFAACSSAPEPAPLAEHDALGEVETSLSIRPTPIPPRFCNALLCNETCGAAGGHCALGACACNPPTCGGMDQPPCAGNTCSQGHFDSTWQLCDYCGEAGQTCCNKGGAPGVQDCYGGTACNDPGAGDGRCVSCGLINQPPCPGSVCTEGHYSSGTGLCSLCGEANQACCNPKGASGVADCYDGNACGGNPALSSSKVCAAACGENGQPPCKVSSGNGCDPSVSIGGERLVPVQGACIPREILTASTSIPAYGDGGVIADVKLTAVSTGTLAMTPVISNSNQLTGYDYVLKCNVGDHQIAYRGNVGNAGFNAFGGSWTHDSPGTMGMKSPQLNADWSNIRAEWSPPMGKDSFKCILTVDSTLQQSLDQMWSAIGSAYLKQFGMDDLSSGDMCFLQTCNTPTGCTSKCIDPGSNQCAVESCDLDP